MKKRKELEVVEANFFSTSKFINVKKTASFTCFAVYSHFSCL